MFDPTSEHYWQGINKSGDWGRAYEFFARLKAEHPDDPDALVYREWAAAGPKT